MVTGTQTYNIDHDYTVGIQKSLNELLQLISNPLVCDGDFGPKSIAALKQFQASKNLAQTGNYDAATQAIIEPFLLSKFVTRPDYQASADVLGVPIASVKAFQETETNGCGFLPSGRVKILFERHWFYKFLAAKIPAARLATLAAANPDIISTNAGGYLSGQAEWTRFSRAFNIDADAAMLATSWGLGQIMGFNADQAGFKTPDGKPDVHAFVDAMKTTEMAHLKAFTQFIKSYSNGALLTALKQKNWARVAELYNGAAYKKNNYDTKMANNYARFEKLYG